MDKLLKKQIAEQPILPSAGEFIRQVRRAEQTEQPPVEETVDRSLAALTDMDGWKILKSYINEEVDRIKNLRDVDMFAMNDQEIGIRFKIAAVVAEKLEWIINLVETREKYFKENENTTGTTEQ